MQTKLSQILAVSMLCLSCSSMPKPPITRSFSSLGNSKVSNQPKNQEYKTQLPQLPASQSVHRKEAAIYGRDNRFIPDSAEYPYSTIGRIVNANSGSCTGTLISQCHVLTSAHCFYDKQEQLPMDDVFIPEKTKHQRSHFANFSARHSLPDYLKPNMEHRDWAIARLDANYGKEFGYMGLIKVSGKQLEGNLLNSWGIWAYNKYTIAGYSSDLKQGLEAAPLSVDQEVEIIRAENNLIFYRADTSTGSSGAAIWNYNHEGEPQIIGLNKRTFFIERNGVDYVKHFPQSETENLSMGIASEEFFDYAKYFMAEYPCKNETAATDSSLFK